MLLRFCRAWPEGGAAPALMLEYQKSRGRRTALGPVEPVVLRHPKEEQPPPCKHQQWNKLSRDPQA
jgi:hypothetical protein